MRDKSGRFLKGYSGNAGGRPKDEHNIAALARSYSTEAIETLVDLMRNKGSRLRRVAAYPNEPFPERLARFQPLLH